MKQTVRHAQRYRVKSSRRSARFWWQPLALAGLMAPLWGALFGEARLLGARALPPPSEPRAAYVVLTPAEATKALAGMRSSWRVEDGEGRAAQLDMGMFDFRDEPQPPVFLEQGARYPGVWQPAVVVPLSQHLPDISVPAMPGAGEEAALRPSAEPKRGIMPVYGKSLADAGFSFVPPAAPLPEREGECRFYVETDEAGAVTHLLLLSPASAASSTLEKSLARGKARGVARGIVTLLWSFPK